MKGSLIVREEEYKREKIKRPASLQEASSTTLGKTFYSLGFPYVHLEMGEGHILPHTKFNIFNCHFYDFSFTKTKTKTKHKVILINTLRSFCKLVYLEDRTWSDHSLT